MDAYMKSVSSSARSTCPPFMNTTASHVWECFAWSVGVSLSRRERGGQHLWNDACYDPSHDALYYALKGLCSLYTGVRSKWSGT
jgi:hypothetical protein